MKLYLTLDDDDKIQLGNFAQDEIKKCVDRNKAKIIMRVAERQGARPADINIKVVKMPRGPYILYSNGDPIGTLSVGPLTSTERSRLFRQRKLKSGQVEVRNLYVSNTTEKELLIRVLRVITGAVDELESTIADISKYCDDKSEGVL